MHRDIFRLQLGNNRHLIENLPIREVHIYLVGKMLVTSNITSKFGYNAIFSNLGFLRSKTQLTSDITSKVRILRAGTNLSACFRTSASSLVKRNIKY